MLKQIFRFIGWYIIMILLTMPFSQYLHFFTNIGSILIALFFIIVLFVFTTSLVLNNGFVQIAIYFLSFPFDVFNKINNYIKTKKLEKLKHKKYIQIKNFD